MVEEKWRRVAGAVRERRRQLGLTQERVAARSDGMVSSASLRILEAARQEAYRDRTLIGVARALQWPDDAIDRLLAGEAPDTIGSPATAASTADDLVAKIEALDDHQRAAVEAVVEAMLDRR